MSPSLEQQLATYGQHLATLAPPVTEAEIRTRRPDPWRPRFRRLVIAVAAAAVVFIAIGILALLVTLVGDEASPPVTDPPGPPPGADSPVNQVADVAIDSTGDLWAATSGGVVRWDLASQTPEVFVEEDGLPSRNVRAVATGPDGTWVAGPGWVARHDGSWTAFTSQEIPELARGDFGDLAVGPDGTAWVAVGLDGLLRFDGRAWTVATPPPQQGFVPWTSSLAVGPDGTLWTAATHDARVLAYDGETWRVFGPADGLSGPTSNIAVGPNGTVWVGGEGNYGDPDGDQPATGIARFDGTSWTRFTVDDGLLSNQADVAVGLGGDVWAIHTGSGALSEADGVSQFDGNGWISHVDVAGDGAHAVVAPDGTLWMPSDEGVVGFDGTAATLLAADENADTGPMPAIVLDRAPNTDSVLITTSIGDVEFTTLRFPPGNLFWKPIATADGPVAVDPDTGTLRWSTDGVTWEGTVVSTDPWHLATAGDRLVVSGSEGAVRLDWTGDAWTEVADLGVPDGTERVIAGSRGWVAVSGLTVLHSTDGLHFNESAHAPNKRELPPMERDAAALPDTPAGGCDGGFMAKGVGPGSIGSMLATDGGFVALTAAHPADWNAVPICEPLLWSSPDGDVWELVTTVSPFGADAFVQPEIAERNGRFVAVGGIGASGLVWVSDDGLTWERTDVELDLAGTVAAGEMGWVVAGVVDDAQSLWTSTDGLVWGGPYRRPDGLRSGWLPAQLAVGTDMIFGIGGRDFVPVVARLQD